MILVRLEPVQHNDQTLNGTLNDRKALSDFILLFQDINTFLPAIVFPDSFESGLTRDSGESGPDDSCFIAAWAMSKSALVITQTKTAKTERYLPNLMFSKGMLIGKHHFQDGTMLGKTAFLGHFANKF